MQYLVSVGNVVAVVEGYGPAICQKHSGILCLRRADVARKPDVGKRGVGKVRRQRGLRLVCSSVINNCDMGVPPRLFQRCAHGDADGMGPVMVGMMISTLISVMWVLR